MKFIVLVWLFPDHTAYLDVSYLEPTAEVLVFKLPGLRFRHFIDYFDRYFGFLTSYMFLTFPQPCDIFRSVIRHCSDLLATPQCSCDYLRFLPRSLRTSHDFGHPCAPCDAFSMLLRSSVDILQSASMFCDLLSIF